MVYLAKVLVFCKCADENQLSNTFSAISEAANDVKFHVFGIGYPKVSSLAKMRVVQNVHGMFLEHIVHKYMQHSISTRNVILTLVYNGRVRCAVNNTK